MLSRQIPWILVLSLACRSDKSFLEEEEIQTPLIDADGDGFTSDEDCDDTDDSVYPDAQEVCDGLDNDCDDTIDEDVTMPFYADADGDGFGDSESSIQACEAPTGYVDDDGDCDDSSDQIHPDVEEVCDSEDNDCDGEIDEDVLSSWYPDADSDGYGDPEHPYEACEPLSGYVSDGTDCNDTAPTAWPGAEEVCDEIDNDCDGTVDEDVTNTYYVDSDGDGYGIGSETGQACIVPIGFSESSGDCDDADDTISPDAEELCDEIDNDCDGDVDEADASDASTWYADADSDGYGDVSSSYKACEAPSGHVAYDTDCDDTDSTVHPAAEEICDEIDNDCDGYIDDDDSVVSSPPTWHIDYDGDGFGSESFTAESCEAPSGYIEDNTDCDDSDDRAYPGAEELCDEIDNDCDGDIDEDDATDIASWYADADSDGYGDAASFYGACEAPSGYVDDNTDCDDDADAVHPGAEEICDDIDNDCDGDIDDDDSDVTGTSTWYVDDDLDGYGDPDVSSDFCDAPSGYVEDDSDCDDSDDSINPGATEIWYDGVDSDCDESSDYDADGDGDNHEDYGGTDCDDTDDSIYDGEGCRPLVSCTHPTTSTLATYDPSGVSDLVFDDECRAWVSTVISGQDYIYSIDSLGNTSVLYGTSNQDITSLAIDPITGSLIAGYSSTQGIGYESGGDLPVLAASGGSYVTYGSWGPFSNAYMNDSPAAIVMDSAGCIWAPNWASVGELACVETDGTVSTLSLGSDSIISVDLDSAEQLFAAIDDTIYEVDTSTGTRVSVYVASDAILDFTFDFNDDIYVETVDDVITLVEADFSAEVVFANVSGDAKLAISPDGYLVRMLGDPTSAASYEEFELDN